MLIMIIYRNVSIVEVSAYALMEGLPKGASVLNIGYGLGLVHPHHAHLYFVLIILPALVTYTDRRGLARIQARGARHRRTSPGRSTPHAARRMAQETRRTHCPDDVAGSLHRLVRGFQKTSQR